MVGKNDRAGHAEATTPLRSACGAGDPIRMFFSRLITRERARAQSRGRTLSWRQMATARNYRGRCAAIQAGRNENASVIRCGVCLPGDSSLARRT